MNLAWDDALWAAAALCVDPTGLRGVWLRAPHGPVRDEWLTLLSSLHPALRRLPGHADSERLLGGLDLGATLHAGRAVYQPGVLTQPTPTLLLLPMAERLPDDTAAILGQVLDMGQVNAGRHQAAQDTFIGLVALDESLEDEPPMAGGLQERLGIWLDLRHMGRAGGEDEHTRWLLDSLPSMDLSALREHALNMPLDDVVLRAVCQTADALGVHSLRAALATVRLARLLAALRGSDQVQDEDWGRAARLVLTPRATRVPAPNDQQAAPPEPEPEHPNESPPEEPPADDALEHTPPDPLPNPPASELQEMAEVLLEAALASLPADVLAQLAQANTPPHQVAGKVAAARANPVFCAARPCHPVRATHAKAPDCTFWPRSMLRCRAKNCGACPAIRAPNWRFAPKISMCTVMPSTAPLV